MKTKEKHPVYFLRTSDFKPIKGIKEYEFRCWFEKISHDSKDKYDWNVIKGKAGLVLYNAVIVSAGAFGIFMGITKGLELILR